MTFTVCIFARAALNGARSPVAEAWSGSQTAMDTPMADTSGVLARLQRDGELFQRTSEKPVAAVQRTSLVSKCCSFGVCASASRISAR